MEQTVKKDTILIITSGDYSNYGIETVIIANKNFDLKKIGYEYLTQFPDEKENISVNKFIKWLVVDKKLVNEISYSELWIKKYPIYKSKFSTNNEFLFLTENPAEED